MTPVSGGQTDTNNNNSNTGNTGSANQTVIFGGPSCNLLPQAQPVSADIILRSGPDTTYDVVQLLAQDDVLQLLGRFGFGPWWYVELLDGTQRRGWVADTAVRIAGYVDLLPELGAPSVNGVAPTPAPRWQITPVPNNQCSCGLYPVLQASADATSVYSAPGRTFPVVGALNYLSISPIQARYQFGEWWQIKLPNGTLGWIENSNVLVYGHTTLAPVIGAAEIGAEVIPGAEWNLEPHPECVSPAPEAVAAAPVAEIVPVYGLDDATDDVVAEPEAAATDTNSEADPVPTAEPATTESDSGDTIDANDGDGEGNQSAETEPDDPTAEPTAAISAAGSDDVQINSGEGAAQGGGAIDLATPEPESGNFLMRALLSLAGGLGLGAATWYYWLRRNNGDSVKDELT